MELLRGAEFAINVKRGRNLITHDEIACLSDATSSFPRWQFHDAIMTSIPKRGDVQPPGLFCHRQPPIKFPFWFANVALASSLLFLLAAGSRRLLVGGLHFLRACVCVRLIIEVHLVSPSFRFALTCLIPFLHSSHILLLILHSCLSKERVRSP